ncbi:hypothetical protein [Streptomyces sp. NPDC056628]|uniref:hypothetical protein n=1 Tax=Streptomyces sp. NPDC056628 TaxID=3345882 RepID=UPI003698A4B7
MIVTAVLLLPALGALLLVMSRVEDWLAAAPGAERRARHARDGRRHLRLIRGGAADAPARPEAKPSTHRAHAA